MGRWYRRRLVWIGAGVLVCAWGFAAADYARTAEGQWLRRLVDHYDGCMCDDCMEHYSVFGATYHGGCTSRGRSGGDAAVMPVVVTMAVGGAGVVGVRRAARGHPKL